MTHLASFPMGLTTGGEQGGMPPPSPPYPPLQFPNQTRSNSFSFNTSEILLFTGIQKSYGPEIPGFLPCMLQFLDNLH